MENKIKDGIKSYKELLAQLNILNNTKSNDLNEVNKELKKKYPKLILFSYIDILSYEKKTQLYLQFKKNIIPNFDSDLLAFKINIYSLYKNIVANKKYEENEYVLKETERVINEINKKSYLKKFIDMIEPLLENYSQEEKTKIKILITNPLKFNILKKKLHFEMEITDFYSKASLEKNINDFKILADKNKSENKNKLNTDENEKSKENLDTTGQTNLKKAQNEIISNNESNNQLNSFEEIKTMIKNIIDINEKIDKTLIENDDKYKLLVQNIELLKKNYNKNDIIDSIKEFINQLAMNFNINNISLKNNQIEIFTKIKDNIIEMINESKNSKNENQILLLKNIDKLINHLEKINF